MSIREEFEKWYSYDGDYLESIERDESGKYKYAGTVSAFEAYCGGVKLQGKRVKELQIQLEQERDMHKKYGLMLSAALRGEKRNDEPDNDGRLEAVREMYAKLNAAMEGVK